MFKKFDNYDGVCFFNGLIFYAPVALLIRTQAGVHASGVTVSRCFCRRDSHWFYNR